MRPHERIPLHDHRDRDSGGLVAQSTVVTQVTGEGSTTVVSAASTADAISITDAGAYFAGTTVEAALQELGAGGTGANDTSLSTVAAAGATETLDVSVARTHDVTLTADCTFTFTGAVTAEAWFFSLVLRQDGTGGWVTTWPASVVWPGGVAPTLDTAPSTLEVLTFFTLDGGTTWYGFPTGGSTVAALDDLTDVTAAAPVAGDRLRFNGSTWTSSSLAWVPAMTFDGTNWLVAVDGSGNAIMTEA